MKRMKQVLALLLSLALLLGMAAVAEEAEAPVEAEVVEIVEEAEPAEEPAPEPEEAPEEPEVVDPEAEEPVEEPAEEPVEEPEAGPAAEEEFSMEAESFDEDSDFVIRDGELVLYKGHDINVVIPDSVTSIGEEAFMYNETIQSVSIPDSVTKIGEGAFSCCTALEEVRLPNEITEISKNLFVQCESLRSIDIPDGVTRIANNAFDECAALASVNIPQSVTRIGKGAFADCTSLESIDLPSALGDELDATFVGCTALKSITVPKEVYYFPDTFCNCTQLETVVILRDDTEWNVARFDNAFMNCVNLKSVYLPQVCNLEDIPMYDENDELCDYGVFFNCPQVTVYVYKGSRAETYCKQHHLKYAYWKGVGPATDAKVTCSPTSATLTQKETVTLKPKTEGLKKAEKYSFTSSDKGVATVNSKGKITAQAPGTATITATGKTSKQSATCTVTVIPAPTKVSIAKPTKVDYTTDDAAFSLAASVEPADAVQSIKWTSSDETVARVSEDGQVTLVGQGKATITAKSEKKGTNGKQRTDTFVLNVEDLHMPANVKIVEKASGPVYVDKDKPLTLHYAMDPVKEGQTASSAVTWSIPKAKERKIATINSETGEITPIKEGSATVKITTQKKGGTGSKKKQLTDTVKITVVDPLKPRSVQINDGEKEIPLYYEAGKTLELKSTIEPETATPGVKWSISSKEQRKIATVDSATGVVTPTGTKFGVVTVKVETTAKKSNKKAATATIKIAVVDPKYPYSVKITQEDGSALQDGVELKVGQTLKLSAAIEPATATEKTGISWSISKSQKKYATVAQDGTVTGAKAGKTVTVTAKTANGKKATIKIKIVP